MTLHVDLTDPDDLAAKMPEIRDLLAAKRSELLVLQEQVALMQRQIRFLHGLAGDGDRQNSRSRTESGVHLRPAQDRVVNALAAAGRPMTPSALLAFMREQGMDAPARVTNVDGNLRDAAKAGRVRKTPAGFELIELGHWT